MAGRKILICKAHASDQGQECSPLWELSLLAIRLTRSKVNRVQPNRGQAQLPRDMENACGWRKPLILLMVWRIVPPASRV